MNLIINNSSMTPIYLQIVEQIKTQVSNGVLKENDPLPSVRNLAGDLKISALTVKKAYDELEAKGVAVTVHGKGTYIASLNTEILREDRIKELEANIEELIQKAERYDVSIDELTEIFNLISENMGEK